MPKGIPEKLLACINSLTEAEAGELYDWFDNEPHAELIIQYHIAALWPGLMDVPPEFWTLMNPERNGS